MSFLGCPDVPHVSLGTMVLEIRSFGFRGQKMGMYRKNWTLGVFLKCHLLLFYSQIFSVITLISKKKVVFPPRELNVANI